MGPAPVQPDLFGGPHADDPAALVRPTPLTHEAGRLAPLLPPRLHLGTSSWSFPGWAGLVYAEAHEAPALARYGLAAYAQHPLLDAVGLDRTFYAPVGARELARHARAVPRSFRFVVKAYSAFTTAPESGRAARLGRDAGLFLDADRARSMVVEPAVQGLGETLGLILFQFSPLGPRLTRAPHEFVTQLTNFLQALPRGAPYAVELRDPEPLGEAYERALAAAGAVHCAVVHPRMPPVDRQAAPAAHGPLLVRWMLHPGRDYESASASYAPFSRLIDPDPVNRERIVNFVRPGLEAGRDVYVIANNNAEGSAPLTLLELAKLIVRRSGEAC